MPILHKNLRIVRNLKSGKGDGVYCRIFDRQQDVLDERQYNNMAIPSGTVLASDTPLVTFYDTNIPIGAGERDRALLSQLKSLT
ncbi:unnamed protein product, partial [Amoebophrya sp. A25]|eukprot:GSA25T00000234001.1